MVSFLVRMKLLLLLLLSSSLNVVEGVGKYVYSLLRQIGLHHAKLNAQPSLKLFPIVLQKERNSKGTKFLTHLSNSLHICTWAKYHFKFNQYLSCIYRGQICQHICHIFVMFKTKTNTILDLSHICL